MYSPYARTLLTKVLQTANEDQDESVALTFSTLASHPSRWPEVRPIYLTDIQQWPAIAAQASRINEARLERMVARGEVRIEDDDERLEAETFYRLLAEHHVHTNPDAELRCLIHKPRFLKKKKKSAYEHVHGKRPGKSPLSEVASSDDEPEPGMSKNEKKLRIVIVNPGGDGEKGEGEWERLAREARESLKRKRGDEEEGEPKKWTKAEADGDEDTGEDVQVDGDDDYEEEKEDDKYDEEEEEEEEEEGEEEYFEDVWIDEF